MFKFKCQFYGLNDELQWFVHRDFEGWKALSSYKRAEPSRTIKSGTKKLFVECFSGSRQDILQLLQTWETISRNKSFYVSKEVKEFTKILLRQKAQETHQPYDFSISKDNICSVKNKYPLQHTPPVFLRFKFYWSSTLLLLSSDGSGSLHCMTKGTVVWCAFVI